MISAQFPIESEFLWANNTHNPNNSCLIETNKHLISQFNCSPFNYYLNKKNFVPTIEQKELLKNYRNFKYYPQSPFELFCISENNSVSKISLPTYEETILLKINENTINDYDLSELKTSNLLYSNENLFIYNLEKQETFWKTDLENKVFRDCKFNKRVPSVFSSIEENDKILYIFDNRKQKEIFSFDLSFRESSGLSGSGSEHNNNNNNKGNSDIDPLSNAINGIDNSIKHKWSYTDGTKLAVCYKNRFNLWDLRKGKEPIFQRDFNHLKGFDFDPFCQSGFGFVICADGNLYFYNKNYLKENSREDCREFFLGCSFDNKEVIGAETVDFNRFKRGRVAFKALDNIKILDTDFSIDITKFNYSLTNFSYNYNNNYYYKKNPIDNFWIKKTSDKLIIEPFELQTNSNIKKETIYENKNFFLNESPIKTKLQNNSENTKNSNKQNEKILIENILNAFFQNKLKSILKSEKSFYSIKNEISNLSNELNKNINEKEKINEKNEKEENKRKNKEKEKEQNKGKNEEDISFYDEINFEEKEIKDLNETVKKEEINFSFEEEKNLKMKEKLNKFKVLIFTKRFSEASNFLFEKFRNLFSFDEKIFCRLSFLSLFVYNLGDLKKFEINEKEKFEKMVKEILSISEKEKDFEIFEIVKMAFENKFEGINEKILINKKNWKLLINYYLINNLINEKLVSEYSSKLIGECLEGALVCAFLGNNKLNDFSKILLKNRNLSRREKKEFLNRFIEFVNKNYYLNSDKEKIGSEELDNKKLVNKESVKEKLVNEQSTNKKLINKELVNEKSVSEKLINKRISLKEKILSKKKQQTLPKSLPTSSQDNTNLSKLNINENLSPSLSEPKNFQKENKIQKDENLEIKIEKEEELIKIEIENIHLPNAEKIRLQKSLLKFQSILSKLNLKKEVKEKLQEFSKFANSLELEKAEKERAFLVKNHWKENKGWLFYLTTILGILKRGKR